MGIESLYHILTPTAVFFAILAVGCLLGEMRIGGVSVGPCAVLLIAVAVGLLLEKYCPRVVDAAFLSAMEQSSKTGTALFVSAIGLSAGATLGRHRGGLRFFGIGVLMVCAGFLVAKTVEWSGAPLEKSLLLGILCGALTSTPGLSAVCENPALITEQAILGYGVAYIFGVVGVVLFVRCAAAGRPLSARRKRAEPPAEGQAAAALAAIAAASAMGQWLGAIPLPAVHRPLGATGGVLLCGILLGAILGKWPHARCRVMGALDFYRKFGLATFFVGTGVMAGRRLDAALDARWFLLGALITAVCVAVGCLLFRLLLHSGGRTHMLSAVAGGMTSTPALGALIEAGGEVSLPAYSFAYLGALLTAVIGIGFL